ncbi:MAG: hypothetical protein KDA98_06880 [Acidimicrobiales bacterium]|nr:hypothetical protein [Acidimicrobiales bacterium]
MKRLLLVLTVAVLALSACSGSSSDGAGDAGAAGTEATADGGSTDAGSSDGGSAPETLADVKAASSGTDLVCAEDPGPAEPYVATEGYDPVVQPVEAMTCTVTGVEVEFTSFPSASDRDASVEQALQFWCDNISEDGYPGISGGEWFASVTNVEVEGAELDAVLQTTASALGTSPSDGSCG